MEIVKFDGAIPAASMSRSTCSVSVRICLCAQPSRMELKSTASGLMPRRCMRPSSWRPCSRSPREQWPLISVEYVMRSGVTFFRAMSRKRSPARAMSPWRTRMSMSVLKVIFPQMKCSLVSAYSSRARGACLLCMQAFTHAAKIVAERGKAPSCSRASRKTARPPRKSPPARQASTMAAKTSSCWDVAKLRPPFCSSCQSSQARSQRWAWP
mmetsp:Transcript_74336/g.208710  ORF Transcript_74336/g.208710 Transcript_74336/m.208710 type:complete len:211 (+) Transcript_74336:259-891(+)